MNKTGTWPFRQTLKINGTECKIFDSWSDLQAHIRKNKIKGHNLLIVQGAHGSFSRDAASTQFSCNERISAKDLYASLKEISKENHAFSYIDSCYSASLLELKLIDDLNNPLQSSISNLCLWTASTFSQQYFNPYRPSDGVDFALSQIQKGQSFEDLYQKNPEGLLSSAEWDGTGVTNALLGKGDDLETMNRFLKLGKSCSREDLSTGCKICSSLSMNSDLFRSLYRFNDIAVNTWAREKTRHLEWLDELEKTHPEKSSCIKKWKSYAMRSYPEIPRTVDIYRFYREGSQKPEFSECGEMDFILQKSLRNSLQNYRTAGMEIFNKLNSSSPPIDPLLSFSLDGILSALNGATPKPVQEQEQYRRYLLGLLIGKQKFGMQSWNSDLISVQTLMSAFGLASIEKPRAENAQDQIRKRICREALF